MLKEEVVDLDKEPSRLINWNRFCWQIMSAQIFKDMKAIFTSMLNSKIIYADGLSNPQINQVLTLFSKGKIMYEADYSKFDSL